MKKIKLCTTIAILCMSTFAFAQDNGSSESAQTSNEEKDNRPVRSMFASGTLLNNQTTVNLNKNTLEMMMQHRFGTFDNGADDLWGIYGPANIRLGFDYGITDRIQAGFGTTKNGTLWDFRAKGEILRQTRSNSIPVAVSYFGDIGISAKDDTIRFKKFVQRLSYFNQIIIARKINDWASVQVAPSYMHYNIVDSLVGTKHDNIAVSLSGRFKVSPQSSVLFEFDYPLTNTDIEETESNPNLGLGLEIATSSHAFHVFIASANGILPQQIIVYNDNDFTKPKEGLMIGFNITRRWGF